VEEVEERRIQVVEIDKEQDVFEDLPCKFSHSKQMKYSFPRTRNTIHVLQELSHLRVSS
jgi:hypothetical protein